MEGWNDGSVGPLLPSMQNHYHVSFLQVSSQLYIIQLSHRLDLADRLHHSLYDFRTQLHREYSRCEICL